MGNNLPSKADVKKALADVQSEAHESETVRSLRQALDASRRELKKHQSGASIIQAAVEEAYRDPPDLWIPKAPAPDRRKGTLKEIAVLHISDTQIGKVTESYDSAIAAMRIKMLIEKTILITEIRRSAAVIDEIHVYLGGDVVEGEDIFITQAFEIDQGVFEQSIKTAPAMLFRGILTLLKHFPKVRVFTVPGNHGRNGSKGARSSVKTNWDNVSYEVLKLMLCGTPERPRKEVRDGRLEFHISETFWIVDYVFDWGNLMVHGDQITGGFAGFPWYGTAKKAWGWIDAIPKPWDYLWFGHFHTYAGPVTVNHRVFLANGTTESDNDYARAQLAAAGHPCQRLCFFGPEHGLIADHQIFLTDDGARLPHKKMAAKLAQEA